MNVISDYEKQDEYLIDVSFLNITNKYLSLKQCGYIGNSIIFFNLEVNFEKQYTTTNGKFKVLEAILDFESESR